VTTSARPALCLRHRAHPGELRHIRGAVQDWARRRAVPEPTLVDLQLVLGEAVANAVEHAYRDTDPGTVEVDLRIRRNRAAPVVAARVVDHGRWRPVPSDNGFRGHGLTIIERIASRMAVTRARRGTTVCFEIPLHG